MIVSHQLSTQQRHETASFYDSMHRLILFSCRGYFVDFCHVMHIFFIFDCDIAHTLYTVKSKHFNVLFNSKKIGFNQNIEIESQHFEFRN